MNDHPTPEPAKLSNCTRCGHPADWHRHDDADNTPATDPACKFRCIGYDCEAPGRPPKESPCNCPDFVEVHFQPPSPAQGTGEPFKRPPLESIVGETCDSDMIEWVRNYALAVEASEARLARMCGSLEKTLAEMRDQLALRTAELAHEMHITEDLMEQLRTLHANIHEHGASDASESYRSDSRQAVNDNFHPFPPAPVLLALVMLGFGFGLAVALAFLAH